MFSQVAMKTNNNFIVTFGTPGMRSSALLAEETRGLDVIAVFAGAEELGVEVNGNGEFNG